MIAGSKFFLSIFLRLFPFPALVVSWSPRLPFKLGDLGSILGLASTQGLKIIEKKVLPLH
jgi:hypothetical protein